MILVQTIPIAKQAKVAFWASLACGLAFALPVCAANSPVSNKDRLISIHRTLFKIYHQQERLDDFRREGECLELLTNDPEIPKALGKVFYLAHHYSEALTHYYRALELGAARDDLDEDIYSSLFQLRRYDEAQVVYKRIESGRVAKEGKLHPHLPLPPARGSDITWRKPVSREVSRTSMLNRQGRQMQPVAMLPASAHRISITLNQCDFKIVHETRPDILLIANYPTHWKNISDSQTQIGVGNYPLGHFHTINGEEIWTGAILLNSDGISLNGKMFEKFPAGTHIIAMATSDDGCMMVNKKMVRIGPLDPEDKSEIDIVQLLVPKDYVGDLELRTDVDTKGDYWHGCISLFAGRRCTVKFEKVTADMKSEIETSGYANLVIKRLEAKLIGLRSTETSSLNIDSVKALEMNLKTTDGGKIDIKTGTVDRLHTDGVIKNILFNNSVVSNGKMSL
jgi:hypothetical protein